MCLKCNHIKSSFLFSCKWGIKSELLFGPHADTENISVQSNKMVELKDFPPLQEDIGWGSKQKMTT